MSTENASPFYAETFLLRAATGQNTAAIAKKLGVKSAQLKKWENGAEPTPVEITTKLKALQPEPRHQSQNKFRFIDLFAGIGGLRKAFENAGGECVFTSEWNQNALETYMANYGVGHPVAGDITKVEASEIPDHDILVGGFPCFPAGTLIETETRFRPIEDIRAGDMVATHQHRLRKVLTAMRRDDAELYDVKITGIPSFKTTDEHPFYVRKKQRSWNNARRGYDYTFGEPEWIAAQDLTGDHYAALPVDTEFLSQGDEPFSGNAFWYLVGRWLGDGWIADYPRTEEGRENSRIRKVLICTGTEDADNLETAIKAAGFSCTRVTERTVVKFHICSKDFVEFLAQFGRCADGKQLPRRIFSLPLSAQKEIWNGWMDADGYKHKDSEKYSATSINRALSLQMARLARNVYGRVATVKRSNVPPTKVIEGRNVNQRAQYHTTLAPTNHGLTFIEGNYAWVKVKSVKKTGETATVYNIEVEEDNSYVAEGVIVHNCQPFSLAGVSKKNSTGTPHGFEDKTQGTLFFDVARIIKEKRPKAFLLENVRNLAAHDKGRTFEVIKNVLQEELGYTIAWKIMEGTPWVPQRRPRIAIVGFRDGFQFDFDTVNTRTNRQPVLGDILHAPGEAPEGDDRFATDGVVHDKYTLTDGLWAYLQAHAALHKEKGNGFGYGMHGPNDIARTLTARYYKDGAEILIHQEGKNPRRLTPRECARLMGFEYPGEAEMIIPVSDTQAYKQFGNSVIIPMFAEIAKAMVPTVLEQIAEEQENEKAA
ncbi:DNA (cytosine-5-)-methyltransferase [Mesorhizobium sp. SP-1A]|uniref:DNA (cytosine-5-)-methyltransferase n=1 Tax=Mesorhizobium sp. SP-1A TaxID=3077840 RepID=UPI0028F702EB|nr:DNA (cytosine-5-)-methyltransferase [Mesorhizobium sp. SP-1A]